MVDSGVERHTLVTGRSYRSSISLQQQFPAARAHLFKVKTQLLRRY
jgi:hypothetical protein